MKLQTVDFRKFQRYLGAQSAGDLNRFLEDLPQNAGKTALIAAGIAWSVGAAIGLYATVQARALTDLRAKLSETTALQPVVPKISNVPVNNNDLATFTDTLKRTYPGLDIVQRGASITITSRSTASFGQFREAIGHVQNGGAGWRVSLEKICVGRECARNQLEAELKVGKVSVDKPL